MPNSTHTIKEELHGVLLFVGAIWVVYFISLVAPGIESFGLVPRTLGGLVGIPAMPFLHANFQHLMGNTIPLIILLALLAGSQARSWQIVIEVVLLGGLLLWVIGRSATHIGASGLVFALIVFLIVSGVREKRLVPLIIAIFVGFMYGGTLIMGVLPHPGSHISWDGHLCGAMAGGIVAYLSTKPTQGTQEIVHG